MAWHGAEQIKTKGTFEDAFNTFPLSSWAYLTISSSAYFIFQPKYQTCAVRLSNRFILNGLLSLVEVNQAN